MTRLGFQTDAIFQIDSARRATFHVHEDSMSSEKAVALGSISSHSPQTSKVTTHADSLHQIIINTTTPTSQLKTQSHTLGLGKVQAHVEGCTNTMQSLLHVYLQSKQLVLLYSAAASMQLSLYTLLVAVPVVLLLVALSALVVCPFMQDKLNQHEVITEEDQPSMLVSRGSSPCSADSQLENSEERYSPQHFRGTSTCLVESLSSAGRKHGSSCCPLCADLVVPSGHECTFLVPSRYCVVIGDPGRMTIESGCGIQILSFKTKENSGKG